MTLRWRPELVALLPPELAAQLSKVTDPRVVAVLNRMQARFDARVAAGEDAHIVRHEESIRADAEIKAVVARARVTAVGGNRAARRKGKRRS